ncbi:MAG: hypothetical protein OFPII_28010 [Osedax symbiont Rs1]|nr:MAG: hypothetical protein OFPII_28010 [Osedax symbiont Rs1]
MIHQQHRAASTAEQLMRARYTAFVIGNSDFIIDTYHSSCHAEQEREHILDAIDIKWLKLEIIATELDTSAETAFVEFKAWYMEGEQLQHMHERSRFLQEETKQGHCWRYIDGTPPKNSPAINRSSSKPGRNDPCPCYSGKKHKKCCGA